MKKRGLIALLVTLLTLSASTVLAEITLVGPEQTTVNFGDQIKVTGTVTETTDVSGFLKYTLACGEADTLATRAVTLHANVQKTFAESFTIPQTPVGTCTVDVSVESNDQSVDKASSKQFTLTDALTAPITLSSESVQLGGTVTLTGTITRADSTPIEGLAKVFFRQGKNVVIQNTVKVTKGKFTYTYDTKNNPAGQYTIEIQITDINNNKQTVTFDNLAVLGNVGLTVTLNKQEFLPGEKVKIEGTARAGDSRIMKGNAYITLDGQQEESTILLGRLSHTITLAKTIKTGEHTITLAVEDGYGNKDSENYVITIIAVPTKLLVAGNQDSFTPEQQVLLTPTLYDQGEDIIASDVDLKVYDAEKDLVFQDTIKSTEQTAFTLPRSATPGKWSIKATSSGVQNIIPFTVGEFKALDITQEGSVVTFANTGNIPIKETVTIAMTNTDNPANSATKEKKISLSVGKIKTYDLAYMAGKGMYSVQVGDKTFDNVEILKRKWNFLPYIAGILGILILYMLFKLWKNRTPREHKTKHVEHHDMHFKAPEKHMPHKPDNQIRRERTQEYYEEKLKRDLAERMEAQKKKVNFSFKQRKDDYIMELPKRRAKAAAEQTRQANPSYVFLQEKKQEQVAQPTETKNEFFDPWKDEPVKEQKQEDKPKKGLFDMFN